MSRVSLVFAALATSAFVPSAMSAQSLTDLVSPENGGTAGQERPPAQSEPEPSGPRLSTGTTLEDGGVAVGESYQRGTFDAWTLTCVKTGNASEPCRMSQNLFDESENAVARFEIFPTNEPGLAAGAAVLAPLGTLLPRGIRMSISGGETKLYPFILCNQEGCIAEFGILPEEIDAMKSGSAAEITVVAAGAVETPVRLNLSLSGFTAGFSEFETLTAGLF